MTDAERDAAIRKLAKMICDLAEFGWRRPEHPRVYFDMMDEAAAIADQFQPTEAIQ